MTIQLLVYLIRELKNKYASTRNQSGNLWLASKCADHLFNIDSDDSCNGNIGAALANVMVCWQIFNFILNYNK